MATRFLERMSGGAAHLAVLDRDIADNVAATIIDSDDERLKFYDQTNSRVAVAETGVSLVENLAANKTVTAEESGKTFFLNLAAGFTVTLPAPAAGLRYRFIVKIAPTTSGGYVIVTNGSAQNIIFGFVSTAPADDANTPAVSESTITFVFDVAAIGDMIDLVSDGTNWYVQGSVTSTESLTFTAP